MAEGGPSPGWSPRLVLFDLDDTLCDYATARLARLRVAFAGPDPGAPLVAGAALDRMIADSLAIHPHGTDHFPDLFAAHGIAAPGAAERAARWYGDNRFHGLRLFPDAERIVAAVRRGDGTAEVVIGILTNGPAGVQRDKLRWLGVEDLADFALVSGEFGFWKPDRAIFDEALRLAGAGADDALMVGDSLEHDIAGARAAGIRAVWMNRTRRPRQPGEPEPDHEIASLAQLPALLAGWRS